EEAVQPEVQRQSRNVLTFGLPSLGYSVDVEVSLADSSYLEPVRAYFSGLRLPAPANLSGMEVVVSNISVTTVCLPGGDDDDGCCFCDSGYAWPSAACGGLLPCASASQAPALPCGYRKKMPFSGPYCEPQTEASCGMEEPVVMNMSVRLNSDFWDDLQDPSSELYRKYKDDLEKAFSASYGCLPGFVSATVTGFSPGSVFVSYQVKAGAASFDQVAEASRNVQQHLDEVYVLNQDSFTREIPNRTNLMVSPADISEGDTVKLTCDISTAFDNVTWYHLDQMVSASPRHSVEVQRNIGSTLRIVNVTAKDSGSYQCVFTHKQRLTLIYRAAAVVTVLPVHVTANADSLSVTCNSPDMQSSGPLLSCCVDRHLPSVTADWRVSGAIPITGEPSFSGNCTRYKLNVRESLCPPEKSGAVTTYTCELQTGHGARRSRNITVTYLRKAQVTMSSSAGAAVSAGFPFSLMCQSDVSNYDSVSWRIRAGGTVKAVECSACIETSKVPAVSVLTVKTATQDWSGTYTCTFSQKHLESSATATVEVIPLPLRQNILIDPIAAPVRCGVQQALECCVRASATEEFAVTVVVRQNSFHAGKRRRGSLLCYTHNYMETECGGQSELMAHCRFVNRVGQGVNSESIRLQPVPDEKISCADSFGVGVEGSRLIKPCPQMDNSRDLIRGNRTYRCSRRSWEEERNDCLSASVSNLLASAESLANSPEARANLPKYLAQLQEQTWKEQNATTVSPANLGAIITILDTISSIPADAEELTIRNFLSTVDSIVADSTSDAWRELNKEETAKSSVLLRSVENFSLRLQPVNNSIPPVSTNTLQLQGSVVADKTNSDYSKSFRSTENLTVSVLIGETEIQSLRQDATIVSVMYSRLGAVLPQDTSEHVNGLLVSTTVSSNRSHKFYVNMTFAKKNPSLKMPRCVFWNFSLNGGRGGWDARGCTPTEAEGFVVCLCDHLTSFSILMSPDKTHQVVFEDYVTYIGLAISILSLAACIVIESLVWKYVTNNATSYMRHVCILNIAASLLIADVWFVVTASVTDQNQQMSRSVCIVATFFIHLFYLCVFFWMLSLGLILFYRLIFILHNTSKTVQKVVAFSLGYGCPFAIAVVTIAVTLPRNDYTKKDFCWLNWKDSKALLAFVIPALIIVATNLFITAIVIIKILRPTIGDRSNRQEKSSLFQIGKSVAILTPLLGLTWGFGLAIVIKNSHRAFHILFALLNALQGLFILVFGTLWDKKIQEALLKRNSASKWSSQQTKSSSLILVTPMLAMSYPFSRTFNNLCGKTG
ncbi:AGRF5 protein, partial [Rhinopomastus cyanomelas]|nr:AGRF5 protein [Rhinopomastus cyanomelas]